MPQGDKDSYTDQQKRKAAHIEAGHEDRGVSADEARRRPWTTINAMAHGGKKPGHGQPENHAPARNSGHHGHGHARHH